VLCVFVCGCYGAIVSFDLFRVCVCVCVCVCLCSFDFTLLISTVIHSLHKVSHLLSASSFNTLYLYMHMYNPLSLSVTYILFSINRFSLFSSKLPGLFRQFSKREIIYSKLLEGCSVKLNVMEGERREEGRGEERRGEDRREE
jgi:hypothetical protein